MWTWVQKLNFRMGHGTKSLAKEKQLLKQINVSQKEGVSLFSSLEEEYHMLPEYVRLNIKVCLELVIYTLYVFLFCVFFFFFLWTVETVFMAALRETASDQSEKYSSIPPKTSPTT